MKTSPIRSKQKLSPKAAAAKKKRDIEYASKQYRIDRRSENQSIGQNGNTDLHHNPDGSVVRMSIKNILMNIST